MTEELSPADYFNSLNANKILIGAITQLKEIQIPIDFFKDVPDSQLSVTLSEDSTKFIFSLRENDGDK
jgi:hypothetical protein